MRALVWLGCLVGCADPALSKVERPIGAEPGEDGTGGGCPVWGCGSNTSRVNGIPFTELHELGAVNDHGFSIAGFEQQVNGSWVALRPDVADAALVARDPGSGALVLEGSQLLGARFELHHARTGRVYYLTVAAIAEMFLWAQSDPAAPMLTPIYRLQWWAKPRAGQPPPVVEDICGPNPDGAAGGGPMADFYAVLFDDDRVDTDELRVVAETPDWFSIGCAGHALAKQHLLGHTKASGAILGVTTTLVERTANLKMITADYCGTGHPLTVPGQPLGWRDEAGWYDTVDPANLVVEGFWGETGALCLDQPRVEATLTPLGQLTFPAGVEVYLSDAAWCAVRPPPCDNAITMPGAHVMSVQP